MLYAILCYDSEETISGWSREKDAAVMEQLIAVQAPLAAKKKLGPVARLMPTSASVTVRKGDKPIVMDGPFAETKEQLLGFYVVDCENLEAAVEVAKELGRASGSMGAHEVRPLMVYQPSSLEPGTP